MKRKHLLFTLLLALVVPLAAFAQVERTVTVFNGNDINAHIPVDGGHGTLVPAKNQFIMDKADLSDIAGKQITKMTFHVVNSNITMKTGDHLPYSVLLAEVDVADFGNAGLLPDNLTNAHTVASGIQLELTGNTLVINFDRVYTYSGNKNLLVQFSCSSATNYFTPFYESYELRFYGVNATRAGVANMGMGIYRHYGFVPKTTFTYLDEATWANTNRPRNLQVSAHEDGYRLDVSWQAPVNYSGSYQVLCVARGTTPNWSNAEITTNTSTFFSQLNTNTAYDIYVRAKSAVMFSAPAKAIAMTKHIANLDNGNLILDFEGAFVPNGVTATGAYSHRLDISRYWYTDFGYGSYHMQCPIGTVNLPSLAYQDANNGVIMEFDLNNATGLQVLFYKQGYTTTLGTFSANGWTHYTVRAEGLGAQNTAYFQLVSSNAFDIDNIVIRKASDVMPVTNLAASNIGENGATISWIDPNINTHSLALFYRPKGFTGGDWYRAINVTGTSYTLTELSPYTQYEVMVQAYNTSVLENSAILTFATACPAMQTTYTQSFTNLSDLPQYWRVEKGNGVTYSVNNDRLTVSNTSYEYTTYGYTYTSYTTLDAYVIMPYFENLQSLQLSFKAGRTAGSYNELVVGVMSDPFNMSTFSILETRVLNGPSTTYNFNLANAAYTHGYIAIKLNHYENNLQNVWFDDFVVTQYAAPTELTVSNVTNTSATLAWTSLANEFEVQYKTTSASTWTSVSPNPTTNTCTVSGLTNNTEYEAQIRAKYGQNQYSPWVSFGTFKTLMQEAVVMNALNTSYLEDFQSSNGNWLFIDGGGEVNRWRRFSYFNMNYGNLGYGLRVTYSADNSATTQWKYRTLKEGTIANVETPATSYAVKTFTLSAGHYEFGYDYAVKGRANDDYMRVVLVPAETVFEAGVLPEGFDYNNTPNAWFSLDGGQQLTGNSSNSDYYGWNAQSPISLDVYPGGTYEPGNYMIVVLWKNEGSSRFDLAQNPPGAIDNVSVTWSSLVYPPLVAALHDQVTDTEAPLALYASEQGITPTSYEVQYEPAAAVNTYEGAPIATFNVTETPQTVTLTGLTPLTLYSARVRSVYTANGHSVYSDWYDCHSLFTTLCPRPTHLVVVGQTSSWANVRWNPVEMTLPNGQYINYCVQLTTDLNDWGDEDCGWSSDSWEKNLAPDTYHFRVRTAVYQEEGNLYMGGSDWSEPITFTIAPWTDPVTIFPLTYDFEEWSNHFADGFTLDGDYENLDILTYSVSDVPTPEEGDNEYALQFRSTANKTACLVLPPLRPSTSSALVSFWWYHDNSDNNAGEGVIVEYSSDGSSWTSFGDVIPRYAAQTGWVKYQKVVPTLGTNASYIRLRFIGSNSGQWARYCYLDDLKVYAFKSEQPYISYVGCDSNSATITLYDYAVENGYHSSQFEVQYREWREPGQPEVAWTEYPVFVNQDPYTFENTLTVNGLQPATCYEFRARARVSYGGYDFEWSGYCEPVRQWTDCGTYTITPSYSYTEDFEDLFNGTDCWTADEGWEMQHEGGYSGDYCAYISAGTYNRRLYTPAISFENCDNVIIRFWAKGQGRVEVHYGENFETTKSFSILPETNDWTMIELPLSSYMSNAPLKVVFRTLTSKEWYVDNISIIANAYAKIFDNGGGNNGFWSANHWYPSGIPTETDDVMIMGNAYTGNNYIARTIDFGVSVGKLVVYGDNKALTATTINASKENAVEIRTGSTLNVTTLNAGAANSVVVKDGGVLYAGTITGTSDEVDNTVVVEDGGQLRLDNPAYVTLKKNIGSYVTIETGNDVEKGGYYLISSPLNTNYFNPAMAGACTQVTEGGETVWTYDLYAFDYEQELEWRNYKVQNFLMRNGRGYLYANRDGAELSFAGPVGANNTTIPVNTNYNQGSHYDFNGWTLLGNPMTCNAYVSGSHSDMSFYRMNPSGSGFIAATDAIKPMEGIFVYTQVAGQAVLFNRDEPTEPGSKLGINLMQGNTLVDNAIIRFGEGGTLPKFSFSNNTSKVYIPMADDDYAVVSSQPVGVLPLNFEAAKDGTYTLNFEDATEGLLYCHLIDNKTGADVDLLATPDYSFNAKADDYASRFKVVFVANDEDGALTGSETFAFNNNGNWIIANEGRATLQVIDLNGRILSSEQIEGSAETRIDAAAGVYVMRLINGENVKTQKVIVK